MGKDRAEYNPLSTEDEKRLFLRNEMARHNSLLAAAAKDAGVMVADSNKKLEKANEPKQLKPKKKKDEQ